MNINALYSSLARVILALMMGSLCRVGSAQTPDTGQSGAPGPSPLEPGATPLSAAVSTESVSTNTGTLLRDPFWPINYTPSNPVTPKTLKSVKTNDLSISRPDSRLHKWEMARKSIQIKGTTRVGIDKKSGRATYFAVINGKIAEEGTRVEIVYEGMRYRWRVTSISEKNVSLAKIDCIEL